jgi:hypothetical protein
MPVKGKHKAGETLTCIKSTSIAYREGKDYTIVAASSDGSLGLIGEDGLFDPLTRLVSEFKPKVENSIRH